MTEDVSFWSLVWAFANSPVGVTLIGGALAWLVSKVWTAKPEWQKVYEDHKGLLYDAVRYAEKLIPDNVQNKTAQRVDQALKYVLKAAPGAGLNESSVKQALDVVHAEIEEKGVVTLTTLKNLSSGEG